ncbi:MAG: YibE/F family protein [Thermoguttaceae bacterium]|nr:YibE/F family protein [Thermoguttaceae bacterium]
MTSLLRVFFSRKTIPVWITFGACLLTLFCNFEPQRNPSQGKKVRARVLEVDDSGLMQLGLLTSGPQHLKVEILSGEHKGDVYAATNQLRAQIDLDKIFKPGDTVLVGLYNGAVPGEATLNAQDHYRIGWTVLLFSLFALLLVWFGGVTGLQALLSFVFSCLVIWKILVPVCLKGVNPLLVSFLTVVILSAVIIFLVAGVNRKGVTAFTGAIVGVLASCLMAWLFTWLFKINGAVMPYSQALLYSGYESLSIADIYIGGIFIGSSGAVMDLGMDVAAGMNEVFAQNRQISRRDLTRAGIRIGQSVVGTMTTTLLLAYSGGYLTLMMTFCAQGTEPIDFINNPYVASEVVKTIVGSFGLVLVAPLTAFCGGFILRGGRKTKGENA